MIINLVDLQYNGRRWKDGGLWGKQRYDICTNFTANGGNSVTVVRRRTAYLVHRVAVVRKHYFVGFFGADGTY